MKIQDMVKTVKDLKGQKPAVVAMNFMASPTGMKVMQSALATKSRVDKSLRGMWDFLGVPSYSDQDRVDRSIGKTATRMREVEANLNALADRLEELSEALEHTPLAAAKAAPAHAGPSGVIPASSPATASSLTNVLDLFDPKGRKPRKAAPKPLAVAKPKAVPKKASAKAKVAKPAAKKPELAAPTSSLLAIDLKKKRR